MQKIAATYYANIVTLFAVAIVTDILLGYPVQWYFILFGIWGTAKAIRAASILWHTNGAQAVHAVATESQEPERSNVNNIVNNASDLYENLDDAGKAQVDMLLDSIRRSDEQRADDA